MLKNNDVKFLQETLTFHPHLSAQQSALLFENTRSVHYSKGENIHCGSNDCIGVLLVKSGELRTYLLSDEGKEVTLYRILAGEVCILSASCLLDSITFDVHIDAQKNSELLLINSTIWASLMSDNVYVENFTLNIATKRFSNVVFVMEQIMFKSFDARLARFLLEETANNKTDSVTLTHEQIAKHIGSAREVVSRMLKYFDKEGYIKVQRGGAKIIARGKLESLI